jgi:hypothetical protein
MSSRRTRPSRAISFCEYVVGTTIPSALGPIPKKPSTKREVVTIEVVTDDETEEDTIRVTYPRSSKSVKSKTTAKKVRFEDTPKKSALKKATPSDSDGTPADSESDTSVESTDAKVGEPSASKNGKNKKNKEKKQEASEPSDSDDDSEPHRTCKCTACIRDRQKQQREEKKASKKCKKCDSDTEATTTDEESKDAEKNGKPKGKDKPKEIAKGDSSGGESQDGSAKETDDSEAEKKEESKPQGKKKKNKNKNTDASKDVNNKDQKKTDGQNGNKSKEKEPEKESKKPDKEVTTEEKPPPKEKSPEVKKESKYPAPYPGPHPRRPNLIAPMRAEVLHTERVVETPEDPIPNAYYDAENNIVRIYHGPVYGHHHQSLYPKRDLSLRPLPIGMPHPSENPYYYGFDRGQNKPGMEHVPVTQGMAMPTWNAFAPMGFPGYPAPFPAGPWPKVEQAAQAAQDQQQNKGAFSLVNVAGAAPSSKDQDVGGGNNVLPPRNGNPYIPKTTKSQFSGFGGSNRGVSNSSPKNSNASRDNNQGFAAQEQQSSWSNGKNGDGNNNGDGANAQGWGNPPLGNEWDHNSNGAGNISNQFGNENGQDSSWAVDNNNTNNDDRNSSTWRTEEVPGDSGGTWEDQGTQNGNTDDGGQWSNNATGDGPAPAEAHNNVMPGAWNPSGGTPSWGDATMAASTGGQVDNAW